MKGFTVCTAVDGNDAVLKFKSLTKKPDIIVMDHRMPIRDGIKATKDILSINHDILIIFASADVEVKDLALEMGAISFIKKPFEMGDLIDVINNYVNN